MCPLADSLTVLIYHSQISSSPFQGPNHVDSVIRYCSGSLHDPCLMSALLCMTSVDQSLTLCRFLYFTSLLCTFSYCCARDPPKILVCRTFQSLVRLFSTPIHLFLPIFFDVFTLEDGTDALSQNVGNKPTYMQQRRRMKISSCMGYTYMEHSIY
jgi:hypothetical protein